MGVGLSSVVTGRRSKILLCMRFARQSSHRILIWRQQDATRNSIEAVGQANFSQKELHGKSCNVIQDMLWKDCGINWNDFPVDCKRGSACYKTRVRETVSILNKTETVEVFRNRWVIDREPPIFSQERGYVEKWI